MRFRPTTLRQLRSARLAWAAAWVAVVLNVLAPVIAYGTGLPHWTRASTAFAQHDHAMPSDHADHDGSDIAGREAAAGYDAHAGHDAGAHEHDAHAGHDAGAHEHGAHAGHDAGAHEHGAHAGSMDAATGFHAHDAVADGASPPSPAAPHCQYCLDFAAGAPLPSSVTIEALRLDLSAQAPEAKPALVFAKRPLRLAAARGPPAALR